MRRVRPVLFALLALALASGCSSRSKPRGRLVRDGEPFQPGEGEIVRIVLFSAGGTEEGSYPAEYNREKGTFRVLGPKRRGVPAGKYRITVQVLKKRKDLLGGQFGASNSPFVREVSKKTGEIVLDLNKPAEAPP
jgi:hypothetical protein